MIKLFIFNNVILNMKISMIYIFLSFDKTKSNIFKEVNKVD